MFSSDYDLHNCRLAFNRDIRVESVFKYSVLLVVIHELIMVKLYSSLWIRYFCLCPNNTIESTDENFAKKYFVRSQDILVWKIKALCVYLMYKCVCFLYLTFVFYPFLALFNSYPFKQSSKSINYTTTNFIKRITNGYKYNLCSDYYR